MNASKSLLSSELDPWARVGVSKSTAQVAIDRLNKEIVVALKSAGIRKAYESAVVEAAQPIKPAELDWLGGARIPRDQGVAPSVGLQPQ